MVASDQYNFPHKDTCWGQLIIIYEYCDNLGYFWAEIVKSDTTFFSPVLSDNIFFDGMFECCTKHVKQNIVKTM